MLAFAWQNGVGDHPTTSSLLPACLLILGFGLVGIVVLGIMERIIPRTRRAVRLRRQRRRELHAAATSELRSRAQMDELCPDGWQAQFTLFSSERDLPPEAPHPAIRVALDWAVISPDAFREPLAERRIWAVSIAQALEAMVSDRMTEETLQQIERQALADGAEWPDA